MFHREPKLPIDRVFKHDEVWLNKEQCILEMVKRMREAKRLYEQQVANAVDGKKRLNEAIGNKKTFKLGQEVLLYKSRHRLGRSKKLTKCFTGPWVICKAFDNGINYLVKLSKDGSKKQVCHVGNMKAYNSRDTTALSWSLSPPEEFDENPFYVVEEIRDSRVNDEGDAEYFVKWKDYGEEDCTWEPIECLANATEALEEFQRKSGERYSKAPASTRKRNSQAKTTCSSARLRK
jgi:hypothetical protein